MLLSRKWYKRTVIYLSLVLKKPIQSFSSLILFMILIGSAAPLQGYEAVWQEEGEREIRTDCIVRVYMEFSQVRKAYWAQYIEYLVITPVLRDFKFSLRRIHMIQEEIMVHVVQEYVRLHPDKASLANLGNNPRFRPQHLLSIEEFEALKHKSAEVKQLQERLIAEYDFAVKARKNLIAPKRYDFQDRITELNLYLRQQHDKIRHACDIS